MFITIVVFYPWTAQLRFNLSTFNSK